MNKINLSIPQPCHENWNEMTPVERGKFCGACQKNVYDFTKASDRQIMATFKSEKNLCGRFLNSQLERDIVASKEKSFPWLLAASGVLGFLSSGSDALAQVQIDTVQTSEMHTLGKIAPVKQPGGKGRLVSGVVSDASGILPGVTVVIKGTSRGTQTDSEGKFVIKAEQGEILVASFVGMKDSEFTISDYFNGITIVMTESNTISTEVFVTGGAFRKRTFFGRIFDSIGNWFR